MLLIDGYNLLFASSPRRIDRKRLPEARERLTTTVARYCEICGLRARIVFDFTQGPPAYGAAIRKRVGNVEVWFTPKGVTADEEILGTIQATTDRTAYTVVTSDRAIMEPVRKKLVQVLDSASFLREMAEGMRSAEEKKDEAPEKKKGLGPGEVDYWMREFGISDRPPDDSKE